MALAIFIFMLLPDNATVISQKHYTIPLQGAKIKSDSIRIKMLIQNADHFYKSDVDNSVDSIEFYLSQAVHLNKTVHNVILENHIDILSAYCFCEKHPGQDAKSIFIPLINSFRKSRDPADELIGWQCLAEETESNPVTAPFKIRCYQNAMSLSHQLNDGQSEMTYLRNIADLHLQLRQFDLAENELFTILKNSKRAGPGNILRTYDLLSALHITKGEYNTALFYAIKTEKTMQATGDSSSALTFYSRLSEIYRFLGNQALNVQWCKKALNHSFKTNDLGVIFRISNSVVNGLILEGKPMDALKFILSLTKKYKLIKADDKSLVQRAIGDSYTALKKYNLAEKSYLEMIKFENEVKYDRHDYDKAVNNYTIGNFYVKAEKYKNAKKYLIEALKNYQADGTVDRLKRVYDDLFKVDSALGNYTDAIKQLELSNKLKDSLYTVAKSKQIEELQIEYATEEKERNIRSLENEAKLQQNKLQQAATMRNLIIIGAGMLTLSLLLGYRRYRQKQRSNLLLQAQREEISSINNDLKLLIEEKNSVLKEKDDLLLEKELLFREMHHRVKNNLQIMVSLLNTQSNYLENDAAIQAIRQSQERMHAISLIHQKLYKSENATIIYVDEYVHELVGHIRKGLSQKAMIFFDINICDLLLDVSQAVPLGLILNEAISNAIKYAFVEKSNGVVSISITKQVVDELYLLKISDNGVGFPPEYDIFEKGSFGLRLIQGLSKQLGGSSKITSRNGVQIEILFKLSGMAKLMQIKEALT